MGVVRKNNIFISILFDYLKKLRLRRYFNEGKKDHSFYIGNFNTAFNLVNANTVNLENDMIVVVKNKK